MKILTFTTLFPSEVNPGHGIFVETRLRHLVASGKVQAKVVAPVPWFPFKHSKFGRYSTFARTPHHEVRAGLSVVHPRYPSVPKVGMTVAPFLLANAAKRSIQEIVDDGFDFDLIDAHYFYPDGVAATALGQHFKKPVVITARGSDLTQITRYRLPRKMICSAAEQADGVITVCNALRDEMIRLGIDPNRITSLRNGVDLQRFHPVERDSVRKALGLQNFTLLSVGHLVPVKGHSLTIAALPLLPDVRLLIAGNGPERGALEELSHQLGVDDRVTFLGAVPQVDLKNYYSAADALVLSSIREGWANVLLESMACGTPVVASNVWGTPEVVAEPEAGILMSARTPRCLADAVMELRSNYPDRSTTRRYAERFSWDETTSGQIQLFNRVLNRR